VKRTKRTNNRKTSKTATKVSRYTKERTPLVEHLKELKRRIVYVVIAIAIASAVVYGFERVLIDVLLRPSHGQHFVYTSPMGGINFLFNVCLYFGVALSVPVIIYNLLKFLQPIMRDTTQRFIVILSMISGVIAICGILFGYFAGLPAALHFLLRQQFQNGQVEALISIQAYFSFVVSYMFGAALMFQLPLVLVIINRIKPLSPKKMLKYERAVILFAFVAAFIMNPTPNLIDQLLTVVPVLISYQFGIVIVWFINRRTNQRRYGKLFDQDATARQERLAKARGAIPLPIPDLDPVADITDPPDPLSLPKSQPVYATAQPRTESYPPRPVSPRYVAPRPDYSSPRGQLVQL
jgi:sec-independent protein translocase protein TatC